MLDFVFQVIVAPLLEHVYPLADPTYGRYLLPLSPFETALAADAELCVNTRRRRVFIEKDGSVGVGEDITHIEADLKRVKGNKWMYYQVWTSPIGKNGPAAGCDIIFIHGMGDYGGKWAVQVASLLRHGFRVIAPDLPGHGRSTGLQCFITNKYELANGVRAVVKDVSKWSREPPRRRMMLGESLGGYTALTYSLPNQKDPATDVDGLYLQCPLIGLSPELRPHPILVVVGKIIRSFLGRLAIPREEGLASRDPSFEAANYADPRTYHGGSRIATGLSLMEGLQAIDKHASKFDTSIRIIHGDSDRMTSHHRSIWFINQIMSTDKSIKILPGREHILFKLENYNEEDELRQEVFQDRDAWLLERVK